MKFPAGKKTEPGQGPDLAPHAPARVTVPPGGDLVDLLADAVPDAAARDAVPDAVARDAVLATNAQRLYGFPSA